MPDAFLKLNATKAQQIFFFKSLQNVAVLWRSVLYNFGNYADNKSFTISGSRLKN